MTTTAFEFKSNPFNHQLAEWSYSRELPSRAIFWEQGTGKSKLIIDTAAWLYLNGKIDGVLVVAPNGVHRNWVEDEIPNHLPTALVSNTRTHHFQTSKSSTKWHKDAIRDIGHYKGLSVLTISYDGFMTKEGKASVVDFLGIRKVLYILDEAHYIKDPSAARTKSILKSAKYAPYRRILTGTPIGQGAFDLYSQVTFLSTAIWPQNGLSSFTAYKSHFGVFEKNIWNPVAYNPATGGRTGAYISSCVGYRRIPQLSKMLQPIASRVTKEDVLDLPDKLYAKRRFDMSAEQERLYSDIKNEFIAFIGNYDSNQTTQATPTTGCNSCGGTGEIVCEGFIYPCPSCELAQYSQQDGQIAVIAERAIVRLMRLQQITCGYLPTGDDEEPIYAIPGPNRRLAALMAAIEESSGKIIIWARYQLDITLILAELDRLGIRAVRYDGLVDDDARAEAKYLFKGERPVYDERRQFVGREAIPEGEQARVFVGNPAAGSTGLTLTEATTVIYYSNSFKLIDRLQSEDRAHRIGQTNAVLYIDILANNTVDEKIIEALRAKHSIASDILGDNKGDWI